MNVIRIILCILFFVYAYKKLRENIYNRDNWVYKLAMFLILVLVIYIIAKWV